MTDKAVVNVEKTITLRTKEQFVIRKDRIKQKVLEEEEYLSILDKIVERDFYPELTKLKLTTAYIDALDSNDVERLREIQLQLESTSTSTVNKLLKQTPHEFDVLEPSSENYSELNEDYVKNEDFTKTQTLDMFLRKNTSEDNASFEKIMEATRKKQKEKLAWLHQQEKELHDRLDGSRALPSCSDQQLLTIDNKPNNLDTWKYVARNALMYVPDGVQVTTEEIIEGKGKKEKEIRHENTRFKSDPFDNQVSQAALMKASQIQANLKKTIGKIGVDGKLENQDMEAGDVGGYQFVPQPSPAPGIDASPLMTWGEIEGTPMRLESTPAPSFKIADPPRREQLAHSLVEKASKQHREKRKKAFAAATATIFSPKYTPKSNVLASERLSRLSPAAQKLMKCTVRTSTDKSLRASYTPHRTLTTTTKKTTPASGENKNPWSERAGSSITDNLLDLPK